MAQIINTNIASLNAQRNLNASQAGTNQALQRLSSGLRINSAKDDAAGLAISTRFESQIKGLNVAIRNAGDGVSLAQTAEGALGSMTDNLQRIRELALQAANGTNSAADREALQAEAKLLIDEIGRISKGANFNGVNLLDGSLSTTFQVGANAGETISVSIGKLTADNMGVSRSNGVSATGSSNALNVGDLVINGVTIGASRAADDSASIDNAAASSISKAAAINRASAQTGVTAIVDANVAAGSSMTAGAASGSITLNGTTINIDTTGDAASSRASVVAAINAQSALTGITAVDSGDDALGVSLVAADGRNITLSYSGGLDAANTGLAAAGTKTGGLTLVANSGTNEINISGANTANAGVSAGSYLAGVSSVSSNRGSLGQYAEVVVGDFSDFVAQGGYDFSAANEALVFEVTVNGQQPAVPVTVDTDLTAPDVTLDDLVDAVNTALAGAGLSNDVVAAINDQNQLVLRSTTMGADKTLAFEVTTPPDSLAAEFVLEASGEASGADQYKNLENGDLVINGVAIGAARSADDTASYSGAASSSREASGIAIAAAINSASDATGVTAAVNATTVTGSARSTAGSGTATLYINGIEVSLTASADGDANRAHAVSQINAVAGQTGVIAEDNGSSVTLTAADGRNIVLAMDTQGGASAANFGLGNVGEADFSDGGATGLARADMVANTTYSSVTLSSAGTIEVKGGQNGNDALDALGFKSGSFGGAVSGQYLTQVDISTQKGAVDALAAIDNALSAVNAARADLGAIQNRFESTISNLEVSAENLSAANSRIRDADFAAEAANMARSQVLQQAGISILAQANASGQQVLQLLR